MSPLKLTAFSHGAGCGCKISPSLLATILKTSDAAFSDPRLLVGNHTNDDAAVYAIDENKALISTTDFFMPIVDDPFVFGQIASVNAISDVYAMGGTPALAIAILGWPVGKLGPEIAQKVLEGSRSVCKEAGIPLAGGHSIDSQEPIFGLSVTGLVDVPHLKKNNTACNEDLLFLTKPIGIGILTTAMKKGLLSPSDETAAVSSMLKLNKMGAIAGALPYVTAMTDVTGFGLLGHLLEMCEGSGLGATIQLNRIPFFEHLASYMQEECIPGGTLRNWASYGDKISAIPESTRWLLSDPQTSGGLLIAVDKAHAQTFGEVLRANNITAQPLGFFHSPSNTATITIN